MVGLLMHPTHSTYQFLPYPPANATIRVGGSPSCIGVAFGQRVPISRIGKPDAPIGVGNHIIGGIQGFAFKVIRNNVYGTIVLPPHNPAQKMFARDLAAHIIKRITIRMIGFGAKNRNVPRFPQIAILAACYRITEQQVTPLR